jgi:FixJ family two-component response regulator
MPKEPLKPVDAPRTDARSGNRETAFIIDDDRLMAELLERHIARCGVEPVRFDDPKRLLDALAASAPAFLFTDLEMPRMHGAELIVKARAQRFRGTIVLVTAARERSDLVTAIRSGADEILVKPIKEGDLDLVVEKARARSRRSTGAMEALRSILEPVSQGVILLDEELVPFYANRRSREILGAGNTREVGEALDRGNIGPRLMAKSGGAETITFVDVSSRGGEEKHLLVGFEMHECPAAAPRKAYLLLMHDFSEWRKFDELHSRFATYLSHRMRTPLTSARNAVMILSGKDEPLDVADKERFLDIGCRNIEKLISSFDELQKVFMVESGEINACRSLIRVDRELQAILSECVKSGAIEGFKLRASDATVLTCRARLKEYMLNAVEAIARWLGESPYIECAVTENHAVCEGGEEPALSISILSRARAGEGRPALKDLLASTEIEKRLVLERLARALDGTHCVAASGALQMRLPLEPPFDREKDLVHPLHMMLERSGLERTSLHLVSIRLQGAHPGARRFVRLLEASLCALFGKDRWFVARGEEPERFAVFVTGASRAQIGEAMENLRERFAHRCRERGEELYPVICWEIVYCRESGASTDPPECTLLEALA